MSGVRSVLLLCWRDTGHPQGGGSETYLQRIGAQLAASGVAVTLRTARYPGAARREVIDGVRISRAGGPYSVYVWALLAMAAARLGMGPLRRVRPDVVVDTQNGLPFLARLIYGGRVAVLVHHCHREQWPLAGPGARPARLVRRVAVVAEAAPPQPICDSVATVGPRLNWSGCRYRANRVGAQRYRRGPRAVSALARGRETRASWCCPGWCRTNKSKTHWLRWRCCEPSIPGLHLDIVGGGWWWRRLVDHAARLGISDAVTFHGHLDDVTKHHVMQQSWVHVLPSRKEGWGLAVIETAQHAVPTIGYRSSGGLVDSIIDGVTGVLVDSRAELVDRLQQLLADPVLREQLGAKAQARSAEFSWRQSAEAMRTVLESVMAGERVSGVV